MEVKPCVIFLVFHGKGHFHACFPAARMLQEKYDVIFAGVEFFKDYITSQGFRYFPFKSVPFGIGLETWYNTIENKTPNHWHTLKDRWNDRLYHLRQRDLNKLITEGDPVHIFLDAQQATDFIVLYPMLTKNIGISLIHTMLPTTLNGSNPPMNSTVMPDDNAGIRSATRDLFVRKKKLRWIQKMKYYGMDDLAIIRRRIKKNSIPSTFCSGDLSLFPFNLTGIREIVLSSKEFDFPEKVTSSSQYYAGMHIDSGRIETASPEFLRQREVIYSLAKSVGSKLIYCSMGSLPPKNREVVLSFLKKVIQSIRSKNYILLISFPANKTEVDDLKDDNKHVFIADLVPQLEVLRHADLFITHGGLNSIKEAIDTEVPLLVYPVDFNYDQNGNSSRVKYHHLGLRGTVDTDTADMIGDKIDLLLGDPSYKERLRKLKAEASTYNLKALLTSLIEKTA